MKFTINRPTWYRGQGSARSALLRHEDGRRCCIGFVGQQCGVPDENLRGIGSAEGVDADEQGKFPQWMWDGIGMCIGDIRQAYAVNDDPEISDQRREVKLKKIFAQNGDEIEFEG